jgi:cytochrome o ubiquinol oxidase subunit 2
MPVSTGTKIWSARALCSLLGPLTLAGCHAAVLSPAGPIGMADRTILLDALAIMLAIVVPTIFALS